jgi:hypothetical protein
MTPTTADLRARAAFHRECDEATARSRRESIEAGKMLAECLRERLGLALECAPALPSVDHEGIRFMVAYDTSRGHRAAWRAWVLTAAVILPSDEYGTRTNDRVRIETLADLGGLIEEYENPSAF